jgi:hypothetical protein
MKSCSLMVAFGSLVLSGATAYAQGYAPPHASDMHPDSSAISSNNRDQVSAYNHVANTLEGRHATSVSKPNASKATAADVTVGAPIRDLEGKPIGKVAALDPDGVVVDTGQSQVKVPLDSFGKDKSGLLIGITAAKFTEMVAAAHAQAAASTPPAKSEPRPATAADISAGAQLRDVNGQTVGKITAVAADGATVDTGQTKVKLPLDAFGVDSSGLVIGITAEKLNEIIAQADAAAGKKK